VNSDTDENTLKITMTVERDIVVTCNATPHRAATLLDPEEGGIEDIEATLDGEEFELTTRETEQARELLLEKWGEQRERTRIERVEFERSE